jgi:hypothetical protein
MHRTSRHTIPAHYRASRVQARLEVVEFGDEPLNIIPTDVLDRIARIIEEFTRILSHYLLPQSLRASGVGEPEAAAQRHRVLHFVATFRLVLPANPSGRFLWGSSGSAG